MENDYNCFVWDMCYFGFLEFDGMILYFFLNCGLKVVLGIYCVILKVEDESFEMIFDILVDFCLEIVQEDYEE